MSIESRAVCECEESRAVCECEESRAVCECEECRAERAFYAEAARKRETCEHPPTRLYAWTAYDGTLCVCCCECGAVLRGGV